MAEAGILDWLDISILSVVYRKVFQDNSERVTIERIRDMYNPYHEMDISQSVDRNYRVKPADTNGNIS